MYFIITIFNFSYFRNLAIFYKTKNGSNTGDLVIEFIRRQRNRRVVLFGVFVLILFSATFITPIENQSLQQNHHYFTEVDDEELLEFSTYFGGSGDEMGLSASLHYLGDTVVDSEGNIIIVGRSAASDFPIKDAYQETKGGSIDATISKFSPNGSLIFSTFLGGFADDWANCVTLDSSDNIIVGGVTGSENFPLKNAYQDTNNGGTESNADCFISKLSSDGQTLLYSTYFGGTGSDWCYSIATDASNRIAFTGTTYSRNLPMVNANQTTTAGQLEAYVVVLSSNGKSVVFSSYISSSGFDAGRGIDFDSSGNLFVTGQIGPSTKGTADVIQPTFAGGADAFIAKFTSSGTLTTFTYLGGSLFERANDLAIDNENNVILTGYSQSADYPTSNAFQNFTIGSYEVVISKLSNDLEELIFSTYLGGSSSDFGYGVTTDSENNVYVTGDVSSTDLPAYYNFCNSRGKSDVLLAKFQSNGDLLFSAAIGGSELDIGVEIAVCDSNSTAIVGFTTSSNLPTKNAYQDAYAGACDLFILRVETIDMEIETLVPVTETPTPTPTEEGGAGLVTFVLVSIPAITLIVFKKWKKSLY